MKYKDFYLKKEHRIEMMRAMLGVGLIWTKYLITGVGL